MSYTPLIPSNCTRCGYAGESKISYACMHVRQECGNCGAYIKWYPQNLLPALRQIKLAIMELAGGVITDIEEAKKEVHFFVRKDPVEEKCQYWKLLTHFVKAEKIKSQQFIL